MADRAVAVASPQGRSGWLQRAGEAYLFACDPDSAPEAAAGLAMPQRVQPYRFAQLHPLFQMNLPEGFVLEQLRLRLAKSTGGMDPLLLLTLLGGDTQIGRLRYALEGQAPVAAPGGLRLAELLAGEGSRALFASLVDRYLMRTGLSGVQPKVLVPETLAPNKAAWPTPEFIVKSGLEAYPGLAINEFVCMTIARQAGLPVPEFHLSVDGELFVMRRFDRAADGSALGFEDFAVLAGRGTADKYSGSYEMLAKLLRLYVDGSHQRAALDQLFDRVALSCLLGDGDAHLKNFAVLYPGLAGPVTLAPAYDIVCTLHYLPEDCLALNLAGSKSFFAARQGLLDFGLALNWSQARVAERMRHLAAAALRGLEDCAAWLERVPGLRACLEAQIQSLHAPFARL